MCARLLLEARSNFRSQFSMGQTAKLYFSFLTKVDQQKGTQKKFRNGLLESFSITGRLMPHPW